MAKNVTDKDFNDKVLNVKGLVLVDFWAEWCGPCRMLAPIIEEVANEIKDKVNVYKLNVDDNPETTQKYQIINIPTVKIFKNGNIIENIVGVQPKTVYLEAIEKYAD